MDPIDYNRAEFAAGRLTWAHITAAIRKAQAATPGLVADGMAGPMTRDGLVPRPAPPVPARDIPPKNVAALIRARAAMRRQAESIASGGRVEYGLGYGGKDPTALHPFERGPDGIWRCDCSGMVDWCHGLARKDSAGRWRYTDSLEADAHGDVPGDLGDGIPWTLALPGDIVVYGAGSKVGHCGIVSAVGLRGPLSVIHCNGGAPPPVDETGPDLFVRKGAAILRIR